MILTCQKCETRYSVDPNALAPDGKKVRCMKCGHSWAEMPPEDIDRKDNVDFESVKDGMPTNLNPPDSQIRKFESSAENNKIQKEEDIITGASKSEGLNDSYPIKGTNLSSEIDSKDSSRSMIDLLAFILIIGVPSALE